MTLTLLLLACTTGTVSLGDKEGTGADTGAPTDDTGAPADDTGAPTDDTGDTQDTEPQGHPFAGVYDGEVGWEHPDWDWLVCATEITFEVDDQGDLRGDTICPYVSDNGQTYDLPVELSGQVSEAGDIEGVIVFDSWVLDRRGWEIQEFETDLIGDINGSGRATMEFETVVDMGREGDLDLFGWVEGRQ